MSVPADHAEWLRRGGFPVPPDPTLDEADRGVLAKFGHWMEALTNGTLQPVTPDQQRFLRVHRAEEPPTSPFEVAWVKLLAVRHAHANAPAALRPTITEPQLNQLFARLEAVRAERMTAQRDYVFRRLDILAPVQAQLDALDAETTARLKQLEELVEAAELAVKQAVVGYGRSYTRGRVKATFYRPSVTFDNKALQEYAATHPEIEQFKKVGQPRATIRYESGGEPVLPPGAHPEALTEGSGGAED
jgi:uncharacterized protein YifE (UPF0438 family)